MYYVYLIRNRTDNKSYIGYTKDLKRRLLEHRGKKPDLIYYTKPTKAKKMLTIENKN